MIYSFKPIADENCRILILGTMPGVQSLLKQQYYGYKPNTFWKIIFDIFNEEQTEVYSEKTALLLRKNIALWDVLKACEREGSGDAEIRNAEANDFKAFFKAFPKITKVYFNGGNAEKLFKKHVLKNIDATKIEFHRLPSTSPAHATSYEYKLNQWKVIKSNY